MKKLRLVLLLVLAFASNTRFTPAALADDDWNFWGQVTVEHPFDDRTRLIWNPVWRVRDDISETYYLATRQGVGYKASKNLDLAVHYFYDQEKNASGRWVKENRLELQPTLKWDYAGFGFSDRNRFEYRDVGGVQKWRYRNQFKVSRPVKVRGFEFTPYVSDELFYDFLKGEFDQNRASIGVTKKINAVLAVDIYGMVRSDRTGNDWAQADILGVSLNLSL